MVAVSNTVILSPSLTWDQNVGFTRMLAYANTSQAYTPGQFGISLFGGHHIPAVQHRDDDPTVGRGLSFGNSQSFGNDGMYPEPMEYGTSLNWVKGRHTMQFGAQIDHTQFNVLNHNTNTDTIDFTDFSHLCRGRC